MMALRKETLSSRERVRLALQHRTTDRIPIGMVCSGINYPASQDFEHFLIQKRGMNLQSYLDSFVDILAIDPPYIGPTLPPGRDIWGVQRKSQIYGLGAYDEIERYPLAGAKSIADLERYPWPSADWFDTAEFGAILDRVQAQQSRCLMLSNGNIFETAWYMRGFEQIFIDLVDDPEFAVALFGYVADFFCTYFRKLLEVADGRVDLVFTADDLGGQSGLLMSLKTWETLIKPFHARLNRVIHEFGVKVIYHSDGSIAKVVPGLIDMGIDVLQALQFSARGMDPADLKNRFGEQLCFEGGVSVQTTLPFGTPDDVRQEVSDLIRILGKDGGYILGPSHAIQAGTSPENIYALFETALHEYPH
jgi:uroporphyrinogen decarboxylase